MPRLPRTLALLESIVLVTLLCTPGALLLLGYDSHEHVRKVERHRPAVAPRWHGWPAFPSWLTTLQDWFHDALPLRGAFTRATNGFLLSLGESGNATVIVGRHGWLFLDRTLADHQRTRTLSERSFERMLAATLARAEWLQRQGAVYVLVAPPNKNSVYPEEMPDTYPAGSGPTIKDRFVERLVGHPGFHVLDVHEALMARKAHVQVYYRTDSHWNLRGAMVAVEAVHALLAERLPDFVAPDWAGFGIREGPAVGGGLARVLGLHERVTERVPVPRERWDPGWRPYRAPAGVQLPADASLRAFENPEGHGVALFLHDSFGAQMMPWIGRPFARFVEVRRLNGEQSRNDELLAQLVRIEQPDVVIEELIERGFHTLLPSDPAFWR